MRHIWLGGFKTLCRQPWLAAHTKSSTRVWLVICRRPSAVRLCDGLVLRLDLMQPPPPHQTVLFFLCSCVCLSHPARSDVQAHCSAICPLAGQDASVTHGVQYVAAMASDMLYGGLVYVLTPLEYGLGACCRDFIYTTG